MRNWLTMMGSISKREKRLILKLCRKALKLSLMKGGYLEYSAQGLIIFIQNMIMMKIN